MTIQLTSALLSTFILLTSCVTQPDTPVTNSHQAQPVKTKTTETAKKDPKPPENLNQLCNPEYYTYHAVWPDPPKTGIEREEPIVLMTRQAFNEKIKQSPLWDILWNKRLVNGSYGNTYDFKKMFEIIGSSSYIRVDSQIDDMRFWRADQKFSILAYSHHDMQKRMFYEHQMLPQERYEMIELVTLVIDDREQATQIVDTLYQQYLDKVANKDFLSDGETIHTYIEYGGKYFSLWGAQRLDHPIDKCNYRVMTGLTIS